MNQACIELLLFFTSAAEQLAPAQGGLQKRGRAEAIMFGPFGMLLEVFFGERAQDRAGEQSKDAEIDSCSGSTGEASEIYVEFPDEDG